MMKLLDRTPPRFARCSSSNSSDSGSTATLYQYVYGIHRYCTWARQTPDEFVAECRDPDGVSDPRAMERVAQTLDDFVGDLLAEGLAPGTITNHVKGVKTLYRAVGLRFELPYRLSKRVIYADRAPRPEEFQRLLTWHHTPRHSITMSSKKRKRWSN